MLVNPSTLALKLRDQFDRVVAPALAAPAMRQGIILFAASSAGNVLQYAFHVFSSRMLGPVEYGVFTSLLALSTIVGVPAGIAQMVLTQYVAGYNARQERAHVAALFLDWLGKLTAIGALVAIEIALASGFIAEFLNVPSILPVIAMASTLFFGGGIVVMTGMLQGLQRFYMLAVTGVLASSARLAFGLGLIGLGWGSVGALGGSTLANLVVVGIGLYALRSLFAAKRAARGLALATVSRYAALVFGGTLALALLANVDLLIVKHFFTPEEAGYYSAAAVLGKTILFFPGAVFTLIFPKISHRFALGQRATDLARQSLIVTLGLCGSAALALTLFPSFAVHLLFGDQYEASIPLVGWYGLAMGLTALVQLLWMIYIAQAEARFVWLLVIAASALAVALWFFHATLFQVILMLAVGAFAIVIVSEVWLGGLGLVNRHGS